MSHKTVAALSQKAAAIRRETLEMIVAANKGHIGGCFSSVEVLTAFFYGGVMRVEPKNPSWPDRDRFILSKGHACESLYVILADLGFFSKDYLAKYQKIGGILGGHPDRQTPGIEVDTGSLGHGLGLGCGMALAGRLDQKNHLTVVLMGDGECCEGSVWESAMFAARHRLNRLVGIVDHNQLCTLDKVANCVAIDPLADKWQACGWDVAVVDGHDLAALLALFEKLRDRRAESPLMIIAETVKCKGVSIMEHDPQWHHGIPKGDVLARAREELKGL